MKFTTTVNTLSQAIAYASKAVGKNSTLSVLSGLYINASEGQLVLASYNMETYLKLTVTEGVTVEEPGIAVIPCDILTKAVKAAPADAEVVVSVNDKNMVTVKSAGVKFSISAYDASAYPDVDAITDPVYEGTLDAADLGKALSRVIHTVSHDNTRAALCGVNMVIGTDGKISLTSCDGFRASNTALESNAGEREAEVSIIIPGSAIASLQTVLTEGDAKVVISNGAISAECGNAQLISRLVGAKYVNVAGQIDAAQNNSKTKITVPVSDLLSQCNAAKVVLALAERRSPFIIDVQPENNKIAVSAACNTGAYEGELDVAAEGDAIKVGLDVNYLVDALKHVDADSITLSFGGTTSAIYIGTDKCRQIVLPIRLD